MNTLDQFKLDGKFCVITGGAGLLGIKHAEALIDAGANIILVDKNTAKLNIAVSGLSTRPGHKSTIFGYNFDITNEEAVRYHIECMYRYPGSIDVLINNAANTPRAEDISSLTRLEDFPIKSWREDFDVSVTGAFLMSREIGKRMAENRGGVILNIVSDLGIIAPDQRIYRKEGLKDSEQPVKPVSYSVAKHALIGLTKYLATYWADKGVRVNSISPGGVYNGHLSVGFVRELISLIPMGRMAHADEYKAAILFMCSDASSYMTGANLVIDGGRTCW